MQRAATTPARHSSRRTTHQPTSVLAQIRSTQVWQHLSATQQQALQRTLTSVCRSLVNQPTNSSEGEEVHDDRS